jgi:flagellar hook assembly protein FlgD
MLEIVGVSPNPFNPSARVWFDLQEASSVSLEIYDVSGRRVTTLHLGDFVAGRNNAVWDGRDARGAVVTSGVYFLRLRSAAGDSRAAKAVLLR